MGKQLFCYGAVGKWWSVLLGVVDLLLTRGVDGYTSHD